MERILIVEDDKNIRETLKDILELYGYQVILASDGKEGYEVVLEQKPDLVLCDVNMPKMNGFELLSAINQRLKDEIIPPFLFLTAKVEKQDVRRGMKLGADDYIIKPFDYKEVLEIIRLRLDKRKTLLSKKENFDKVMTPFGFDKLAVPFANGLELIAFDKIVKCQADRAYCTLHLVDGKNILVSKPLKEFETELLAKNFIRVHKSTIVNPKYIEKYIRGKNGSLLLSDGSLVPVAHDKKDELLNFLKHNN